MDDDRTANLLGALALGLADALIHETEMRAQHGAAAPAALVTVGFTPDRSIDTLARTLDLSHSATGRLVDRLAKDGLVERRAGEDGRVSSLRLTRQGQARRRAILRGRRQVLAEALGALSDEEQGALTSLMERLLGALTQGRRHADHICRLCDEDVCPGETCPVECAVTPLTEIADSPS